MPKLPRRHPIHGDLNATRRFRELFGHRPPQLLLQAVPVYGRSALPKSQFHPLRHNPPLMPPGPARLVSGRSALPMSISITFTTLHHRPRRAGRAAFTPAVPPPRPLCPFPSKARSSTASPATLPQSSLITFHASPIPSAPRHFHPFPSLPFRPTPCVSPTDAHLSCESHPNCRSPEPPLPDRHPPPSI
jgi:hypothetical protein